MKDNSVRDPLLCVDANGAGETTCSESDSQSDGEVARGKLAATCLQNWEGAWKMRSKNDYTWFALIFVLYVGVMAAAAAAVDNVGEAVAAKGLLVFAVLITMRICWLAIFRAQPNPVRTGAEQLSAFWRGIYNGLCVTLSILLFYTMGLSYLIASFLWHAGLLTDADSLAWKLLFPMGSSSAPIPPSTDAQLVLIGKGTMGDGLPFIVLCLILEPLICCKILPEGGEREHFSLGDSFLSIMTQVVPFYVNLSLIEYVQPMYAYAFENWRLSDTFASESSIVGFWLCVIMADLWYYVVHRSAHVMSWVWTSHMVHHSCEKFNLFNGPRGGTLFVNWTPWTIIDTLPLALFFPWQSAFCVAGLKWTWQFWIHATLPGPWPCLEWVLFSPSLHRVHHLKHEDRLGKNYGCILSIWDIFFGTFEPEFRNDTDTREANYYGVIPQVRTWDVLWLQVQPWYDIFFRQTRFNGPLALFLHWTPPNSKCPKLGSRLNPMAEYQEYPESKVWSYYILLEVAIMIIFGMTSGGSSTQDTGRRLLGADGVGGSQLPHWLLLSASSAEGAASRSQQQFVWTWMCGLIGLWSCSCLGWMMQGESRTIWNVEVLRKVLIISCSAGYMTYYDVADHWSTLFGYCLAQIVLLSALWQKLPAASKPEKGELE